MVSENILKIHKLLRLCEKKNVIVNIFHAYRFLVTLNIRINNYSSLRRAVFDFSLKNTRIVVSIATDKE